MSNAFVLVTSTAVLKNLLENGLVEQGVTGIVGGDTTVSALAPDRIKTGDDEQAQINVFLYQITQRGIAPTSFYQQPEGADTRRARTALTLDLQYLVSAYGAQDLHSEVLLGHALEILNRNAVLSGGRVEAILRSFAPNRSAGAVAPILTALGDPQVASHVSLMKICLQTTTLEDMLNLWSIFQSCYRPSAVFKITVEMRGDSPLASDA